VQSVLRALCVCCSLDPTLVVVAEPTDAERLDGCRSIKERSSSGFAARASHSPIRLRSAIRGLPVCRCPPYTLITRPDQPPPLSLGFTNMNPVTPADRAQKMELRRATVAARNKDQGGEAETSPTDTRATAREAAQTLASMGDVSDEAEDEEDYELEMACASAPGPSTKGKRPAAAGLSPSTNKVGRWASAPLAAFVPTPRLPLVATARSIVPQSAHPTAPPSVVWSGPSCLVGSSAPGAPAGPSGDKSLSVDGSSAVASAIGIRTVHSGVSLRPIRSAARTVNRLDPSSASPIRRVQELTGALTDRPVVLGVRRRTHGLPTLRVTELMTGPDTAVARRAAVFNTPVRAGGGPPTPPPTSALPPPAAARAPPTAAARAPPTAPASHVPPTATPRRPASTGSAGRAHTVPAASPIGGGATGEPGAGRRGTVVTGAAVPAAESVDSQRPAPSPPAAAAACIAAPVSRMMGSTTGGGAAASSMGSVAASAATRPTAASDPHPLGPDVQYPTTAAAKAAVNPLLAALGTGTRGERRAQILERAVWTATSSVRIDVAAMESAVTVMKDTLVDLKTKLDAEIQLSQQTLGRLAAVEKTVLDGIKSAIAKGQLGCSGEDDDETTKKEKLIKLVTVRLAFNSWRVRVSVWTWRGCRWRHVPGAVGKERG